MSDSGKKVLFRFKRRWQVLQFFEILLYGLGVAILVYALSLKILLAIFSGMAAALLVFVIRKPWQLTLERIGNYIDAQSNAMQYSSGLLLLPKEKLSGLATLQHFKVSQTISRTVKSIRPQVPIRLALYFFIFFIALAFLGHSIGRAETSQDAGKYSDTQKIAFRPLDSAKVRGASPKLTSQKLTIRPPSYTNLNPINQSNMQVRALKGSRIFWNIKFDMPVDSVVYKSLENNDPMKKSGDGYNYSTVLQTSGFYNFKFTDIGGASYQSELYALDVFEDEPPVVDIRDLKQFTSFTSEEQKIVNLNATLSDDYGLKDAFIVATVSSGTGESVKFREERMAFNTNLKKGSKKQDVVKQIDLDQLHMEPGDELYFYVAAIDNKSPKPNTSRSETYFAVIEDTISDEFAIESTMGADLMPAYFRSQRQLIIDTKKLIADQNKLSVAEFKRTSNSLGADQKALRLKYGQFMGDEEDSSFQGGTIHEENASEDNDLTAAYTHNHDADTEAGHEHEASDTDEGDKSPLANYIHNHDDPEESTLFTQSLKSKLRQAMQHMWDAELQLRLYEPNKSLPYQYKALKLIQEIKNSARVYVHRIGFDAPPIKEDSRLTGDIESVSPSRKEENLKKSPVFPAIRKTIERLEILVQQKKGIELTDKLLFEAAGTELASLAISKPGKYLKTLQELKWLVDMIENKSIVNNTIANDTEQLESLRNGLLKAIPPSKPTANAQRISGSEINTLFLQELNADD